MRLLNRFVSNVDGTVPPWAVVVSETEAAWGLGIVITRFSVVTAKDPEDPDTRVWWLLGSTGSGEPVIVAATTERTDLEELLSSVLAQSWEVAKFMDADARPAEVVYTHPEEVPFP